MTSASSKQPSNDVSLKSKGVYNMIEKIKVPDNPRWKTNEQSPSTKLMLKDIDDRLCHFKPNTQECQEKLQKLKIRYVHNSNQGEGEGTQTLDSTELAISKNTSDNLSTEQQVSKNLYNAIQHLEKRNVGEDKGLLDVEECIQDTHKILMQKLLASEKCGEFSIEERYTSNGDKIQHYPKFNTKEDAYVEVQRKVDQYNATIEYIKQSKLDSIKRNSMYIRCAAFILYHFVSLHPFSDGNGRMSRLLASHCLYLVFPFPCPIYNIYAPTTRDDYIHAIKKARESKDAFQTDNLGELIALIIESGWNTVNYLTDNKFVAYKQTTLVKSENYNK